MKRFLILFILIFLTFAGIVGASVLTPDLYLSPGNIEVATGETFTINLGIDLIIDPPPPVGTFDVDILYDPLQMQFLSYTLYDNLGDVDLFEAWDLSLGDLGGTIDLAEVSLLLSEELIILQEQIVPLAELTFLCLAPGNSLIEIDTSDPFLFIGDERRNQIFVDVTGAVAVNQVVPEPSTCLLIGAGLAGVGLLRRRIKN